MLIKDDLPTLDRPINAYSGKKSFGHFDASELLTINSAVLIFMFFGFKTSFKIES
ncbi:hypothetical protein GCM10022423_18780 [Flavobacterium ginsengiterrae]|uniref:Uncharacterized protein n=1 Tax=Flavobacterium ginsengiterrae TaxID=871695 RepID=A0ABP7GKR1_9FLAO